ncbi:putative F-box/FBD/LRR-repeat protein At1g78760 [Rutidosis leptorrhynchoides]|uniref:putative F-box/FBD/LRR-repeat protein At1g78760 n=1 Tax=Rutidosis leptorrhynchoides TaxID=125765 RepID=UPI003A9A4634
MDFDHSHVKAALNEDRLSSLPLELIHQILSRFDTKFVVQTCLLLSPRWKRIWTSMPCLNLSSRGFKTLPKFSKFVTNVLSHRNHQVEVSSVNLTFNGSTTQVFVRKIADYVCSHNVQELTVVSGFKTHNDFPPCLFSSQTLKHLTFKTSIYAHCLVPKTPWDFPALTTLYLDDISLCDDYQRESIDLFSTCVNLKNLTLEHFRVKAKVFDIITPQLSNLTLIKGRDSVVINLIAPQLVNITISDCSMKDLSIPSGLSSFYYQGHHPPQWLKDRFHPVNKVTFILHMYCPKWPYNQEQARGIINALQELRSARFLTLNLDIVECISPFPDLLYGLPSPFSNLISLNIDFGTRDTCKHKMSTEARNYLLGNSPNATFIMKELPTQAMKNKEINDKKKAKMVADIKDLMKELEASLEQDTIIIERNQAIDQTKLVIENLLDDIKVLKKKKMLQNESERGETEENLTRLVVQLYKSVLELTDMLTLENKDVEPLISKTEQVRFLLDSLPKQKRKPLDARYSRHLQQAETLIAHKKSHNNFLHQIIDVFSKDKSSTSEDVSSGTQPPPLQTSSSSTIVCTSSTSTIKPVP